MFAAKSSGRDRVHLFSPALREAARWRLEVASRLREDAIDQLVVHYQPVVRLDTGAVEGVEALVRWQHPERGLLPPDAFLAVAEETGQVIPITRWLLLRDHPPGRRVGRAGAAAADVGERQRPPLLRRDAGPRRAGRPARVRPAAGPAGARADRDQRRRGPDPRRGPADRPAQLRRPRGDRRLRHGLVVAGPAVRPPHRHAEDRPLAAQRRRARRLGGDRRGADRDRRPHPHARDPVGRRGRRDPRAPARWCGRPAATWRRAGCSGSPMPADEIPGWVRRVNAAGGDVCAQAVSAHAVAAGS